MTFKATHLLTAGLMIASQSAFAKLSGAQGIMVNFTGTSELAIVSEKVYEFDAAVAAALFTESVELVSLPCLGTPANCSQNNRPPTPVAPSQLESIAQQLASSQRCVFLDGGNLSGSSQYESSVELPGLNGRGTWIFNFVHTVQPAASQVPALTAWNLTSETGNGGGPVLVTIGAEIAAQTVIKSSIKAIGTNYSFDLGLANGSNRVKDLELSVNDVVVAQPDSTIVRNCRHCGAGEAGSVDFNFVTNAGSRGDTSLLEIGDARTILNTDKLSLNNNGGPTGALLAKAEMDPVTLELGEGEYTLKLTGTVKGVDTIATQGFAVTKNVSVVAEGCNLNQ